MLSMHSLAQLSDFDQIQSRAVVRIKPLRVYFE